MDWTLLLAVACTLGLFRLFGWLHNRERRALREWHRQMDEIDRYLRK